MNLTPSETDFLRALLANERLPLGAQAYAGMKAQILAKCQADATERQQAEAAAELRRRMKNPSDEDQRLAVNFLTTKGAWTPPEPKPKPERRIPPPTGVTLAMLGLNKTPVFKES